MLGRSKHNYSTYSLKFRTAQALINNVLQNNGQKTCVKRLNTCRHERLDFQAHVFTVKGFIIKPIFGFSNLEQNNTYPATSMSEINAITAEL